MATALSAFLPYVMPYVDGCPDIVAEQAILRASIEFCERTQYWRYDLSPITPVKNIKEYTLSLPSGSAISSVEDPVYHAGTEISLVTRDWLSKNVANWKTITKSKAEYIYVPEPGKIRLVPYPSETSVGALEVSVILKPKPDATTIPDVLFDEYFECISEGAKYKLFSIPKKDWSDTESSLIAKAIFDDGIEGAVSKSKSGFKTEDRRNKVRAHYY